jgi:hypothetical protein
MKRTFFLAASFMLSMGALSVNAQTASYSFTSPNLSANKTVEDNTRGSAVAGVNTAVTDNFAKKFPGVSNVIWSQANKTTWGYFKQHGVPVRVSYNQNGKLMYTIRYYNEDQVSPIIKQKLNSEGFTMKIVNVTEVKSRYSTTQVVKMENDKSIITLTINQAGEVYVAEEFNKA